MLSAAEIAGMRDTMQDALPDVCSIERETSASDGGGGSTSTWGEHLADVPCRLSPVAGGEGATPGARIADESTHVVTFAAEADIAEADQLTIAEVVYEVLLVRKRGAWEITRRVECKESV